MKLQAQTQIKLRDLAEIGSLPESQCGRAFLKLLVPLLDSGVVCWQRCGVGRRLVVNDADTLRDFYRQRFPNAALPSGAGSRVASVGRFRDTKALTNSEGEIISLRVWQNEALLKNGKPFDAAPLTVAHGVFSFLFTRNCPYALVGRCALTENPAVFVADFQPRIGLAGLYSGFQVQSAASAGLRPLWPVRISAAARTPGKTSRPLFAERHGSAIRSVLKPRIGHKSQQPSHACATALLGIDGDSPCRRTD